MNWQGMLYNKIRGEISDDELRVRASVFVNVIMCLHITVHDAFLLGGVPGI